MNDESEETEEPSDPFVVRICGVEGVGADGKMLAVGVLATAMASLRQLANKSGRASSFAW
jgi:hypothetical protein